MSGADGDGQDSQQQLRLRYRAALAMLGDDERRVLELHRFQGRSIQQIASDLNLPADTIERLLAAALVGLARNLGPDAAA